MWFFLNDQFIEDDKHAISVNDRGFTLGDGVFDTQLAIDGNLEDIDLHFERLLNDAIIIGIHSTITLSDLKKIAAMLFARNGLSKGRWIVRTQITRGQSLRGLAPSDNEHPTIVMRAFPASPINELPITAIISNSTRRNEHSPLSRIKSLNYGDNLLALFEAKEAGADDAILLNTRGLVSCATTSNIFIVEAGAWTTPPLEDGILFGITRLKLIAANSARQEHIGVERLQKADEIYQCNSVIGVRRLSLI